MKKVRKITILLETREALFTRHGASDSIADSTNFSVCPVCNSHLAEPLPLSIGAVNSAVLTELTDDRTITEISKIINSKEEK